jgi:phage tail-like protein
MTFEVTIDSDTPGPIQEGDTYEVTASVTNTGSNTQTQTIELYTNAGQGQTLRDDKETTVDPGDTVPMTLTWNTTVSDAGNYEVSVESEDPPPEGVDTDDVTVEAPPPFPVTVQSTNSPVTAGGNLTVTVLVENTGEQADTQDVTLSVGGSQRDSTEVPLENGQSTEVTLTWETGSGDEGTYDAAVASATDQDTTDVTVESDAEFVISDLTVENAPVTEGEAMCINCAVENVGTGAGARWVGVGVGNEMNPTKIKNMRVDAGKSTDVHFQVEQDSYREGNDPEYEKKIWGQVSFDDLEMERGVSPPEEATAQVSKPPLFDVTIDGTNAPVGEGEDLEVTATVTNKGGETGNETVALVTNDGHMKKVMPYPASRSARKGRNPQTGKEIKIPAKIQVGGNTRDDTGLTLEPGESKTVTLEWETDLGEAGDHAVSAVAIPPWERDDWDGPVFGRSVCVDGSRRDTQVLSVAHGPIRTGRFVVELDGEAVPGWQSVTIPSRSVEQGAYTEEPPGYEEGVWGRATFDDLEMERGAKAGATELYDWMKAVRNGQADSARKSVAVKLKDEEGQASVQFNFTDAWPKDYQPPDLDASADGDVATENITVAYGKMDRVKQ